MLRAWLTLLLILSVCLGTGTLSAPDLARADAAAVSDSGPAGSDEEQGDSHMHEFDAASPDAILPQGITFSASPPARAFHARQMSRMSGAIVPPEPPPPKTSGPSEA